MNSNISCSFPGCTNPVIGQCTGYKGNCGRFYCVTHSSGTLCYEHGEQKRVDEIAEGIYNDYLQTAENIYRHIRSLSYFSIPAGAIGIFLILAGSDTGGFLVGITGVIIVSLIVYQNEQRQIAEAAVSKPDFPDFYKEYKKIKGKESLKKGLAVAGALTVITLGVAAAAQQQQVRDDIKGIRARLD